VPYYPKKVDGGYVASSPHHEFSKKPKSKKEAIKQIIAIRLSEKRRGKSE
jgi:hypothetical protein